MYKRLGLIILAFLVAPSALAQEVGQFQTECPLTQQVMASLAERYGETLHEVGTAPDGSIFEIYMSKDGATFTVVTRKIVNGMDISCVMASGRTLMMVPFTEPSKPKQNS